VAIGATHGVGTQHKAREIQCPFVQAWDVRAVDVAKLALEAFVCDVVLLSGRHLARVLIIVLVDVVEQRWE
jgi:hypothetical protein